MKADGLGTVKRCFDSIVKQDDFHFCSAMTAHKYMLNEENSRSAKKCDLSCQETHPRSYFMCTDINCQYQK